MYLLVWLLLLLTGHVEQAATVNDAVVRSDATSEAVRAQQAAQVAEDERVAAEAYKAPEPASISPQPVAPPPASGCTGFAIPDWIIWRESRGDPTAFNPSSGAIGCAQTLLAHYRPGGDCAGLDPYSIDGQRACTSRLVARYGLSPWAS